MICSGSVFCSVSRPPCGIENGLCEKSTSPVLSSISYIGKSTTLKNGDTVQVIKDLKVRGSSSVIKRGALYKNIRLTSNPEEIESGSGKGTMVLRTEFVKKV